MKQISLKDKIVLGPIERYKKYNHFPWKLLLHIALIAITSFQVLTIVAIQTDFAFNSQLQYLNQFMTSPWDGNTVGVGETISIYNIDTLRTFVENVNSNYLSIASDDNFEEVTMDIDPTTGATMPIEMVVRKIDTDQPSSVFFLNETALGPFTKDNTEVKEWLR